MLFSFLFFPSLCRLVLAPGLVDVSILLGTLFLKSAVHPVLLELASVSGVDDLC